MLARSLLLLVVLALAGCDSRSSPASEAEGPPDALFARKAESNLALPPCPLPGGSLGLPDPVADPLPDRGNGLAAGDPSPAPATLPAQVLLRSDTQTFNRRYQFALHADRLWFKSNSAVTGLVQPWAELPLPACLAGTLIGIAADDDELIALRADGAIYGMDHALKDFTLFNWTSRWGPPLWTGTGHRIPADYLAWSWSVISPAEDQHWTDPAGNRHAIGQGKVSHLWLLRGDGRRYTYVDPWLPKDESYEMCGPLRGRFRAVNLSASGSTIVTVNRRGELYTRHYDFDLAGCDDVFFRYAYEDQRGLANPAIQLPGFDWLRQPKVPGRISSHVSVHKQGVDMQSRLLRVEGLDDAGHSGYWEKEVAASRWRFVRSDQPLVGTLLDNDPQADDSLHDALPAEDRHYARNLERLDALAGREHVEGDDDWAGELLDFNVYCSPATLRVHVAPGTSMDLRLHSTDSIRQTERARGLDREPRRFNASLEVPPELQARREQLVPKLREWLQRYTGDRRFTTLHLSGVAGRITVEEYGWSFDE